MKLSVLALDYDGTIAADRGVDAEVRRAIAEARTNGITVLLVTGRILSELRRVAGDLHFVDGVVAENGGVVHFAGSEHTSVLAPRLVESLVTGLAKEQLSFQTGECLIDADAADGQRLLSVIRGLELPYVLVFNRGRVMVMPQGVSKATGLQTALDMLRLSPRNTVAIGDAENDHELLRLAELGAAVKWGSKALQAVADTVVLGEGPRDTATYIRAMAAADHLPLPARARRYLRLGHTEDGREFSLAVKGRNVLVAGDAKSGKSWIAGLLCEQLILHGYCVCVLDPEGDYRSLEALPGVTILGGEDPPPTPRELLRALRYPDRSVVIDLSRLPQDEKIAYIRAALPAVNHMRRRTGLPHRILLDEAHYFLHDAEAQHLLDLERNGYTVVTFCASRLPPKLLAATEVMIVTCESNQEELDALYRRCQTCQTQVDDAAWRKLLCHVGVGQAVALPITEEAGGELRLFNIGQRLTPHVRHREKYVDVPVTEQKGFLFTAPAPPARARTLREFVAVLEAQPVDRLKGHLQRSDFSRWIGEVFGDRALAAEIGEQEQRFVSGIDRDTIPEIVSAIRGRYDLTDDEEGPRAEAVSTRAA
ncbi:MAG TPA: HAD hydrolase family protein [Vicinamibacterales bacterium]|nr:HAD hydrolase family protein [Vicinamibacterales bacterium]